MKFKLVILLLLLANLSFSQSILKTIPKVNSQIGFHTMDIGGLITADSTMNAWRPVADIAAYVEPGNIAMAGVGISYQHLLWIPSTQKWNCQWSISGMVFGGGSVVPSTPSQIISYGVMLGIDNNLIMFGPVLNDGKLGLAVSVGISLNN